MPNDITKNYKRKRQFAPSHCAAGSFRVKPIGEHGKKIVVCCPVGHFSRKTKRCKVGMKAQSILTPR